MALPPPTERQTRLIWIAVSGLAIAVLVGLIVALLIGLKWAIQIMAPVLWPLAVAAVVAYLLDPIVDFLERKKVPRPRAILLVFVLAMMVVVTVFASVVPQVISETRDLVRRVPVLVEKTQTRIEYWVNNPPEPVRRWLGQFFKTPTDLGSPPPSLASATNALPGESPTTAPDTNAPTVAATHAPPHKPDWSGLGMKLDLSTLQSASGVVTSVISTLGNWLFGQVGRVASWFGVLAGLALIPVYAFYLLLEKKGIESKWTEYLPVTDSKFKHELIFVINSINSYLIAFFRGQVLVAICDGILYTVGFMAIRLPYAVLLGFLATFLTMIPFIGAIVTCALALLIAFVHFGDWLHPALVLVIFAIVQALEGLVISPKIMGDRVGLHPLTIIIAVMAGTTLLGGILGGILAIPLTAVIRVVLARYVWKRTHP